MARLVSTGFLVVLASGFWVAAQLHDRAKPQFEDKPTETALSVPAQLLFAAGDRYLSANLGSWRATMVGSIGLPDYTLSALAKIQTDVAWLNPAHEDNYYTATALLPWEGFVDSTQFILRQATTKRYDDMLPPFYLAFNALHFEGDVHGAVQAMREAAVHAEKAGDAGAKAYFLETAEHWEKKGENLDATIGLLKKMSTSSRNSKLKKFLQLQVERLEGLSQIAVGVAKYKAAKGSNPANLDDLISAGVMQKLPVDPTGQGYGLRDGVPYLMSKKLLG